MGGVQSKRSYKSKTPTLVFDATPLIYLCKLQFVAHLKSLKKNYKLCTTKQVYQEVYVAGLQKGVVERDRLKELFEEEVIEISNENKRKNRENQEDIERFRLEKSGLHPGEISIIQTANYLGATAIIDDKRARNIARMVGVNVAGTANILIELVRLDVIDKKKAKIGVRKMINEGWYCGSEDYIQIINAIDSS